MQTTDYHAKTFINYFHVELDDRSCLLSHSSFAPAHHQSLFSSPFLISLSVVLLVFPVFDAVAVYPGAVFKRFLARHRPLERVEHSAHEDGTEEVLEGKEWVVDSEDRRHETEVDEEDDDTEVDDVERGRDDTAVRQQEDDARRQAALRHAANTSRIIIPLIIIILNLIFISIEQFTFLSQSASRKKTK